MVYKIAVGSSDGKVVNAHFGRAPQFLIFEVTTDMIRFDELRENLPGCSNLDAPPGNMNDTIQLISDCQYVIVSQIGPSMVQRLSEKNIKALVIKNFIEEALLEIQRQIPSHDSASF